ncbi:MAG: hypothetical protein M1510_01565 [Nitrospirae bacterium]|nr:hypothetical protein [Nitrospirota bacterium]MCL5238628.1 hypothetical protein [Nitrospirota bacterium]
MAGNKQPGCEVICRAVTCIHNDGQLCAVFTMDEPLVLGVVGLCEKYDEGLSPLTATGKRP